MTALLLLQTLLKNDSDVQIYQAQFSVVTQSHPATEAQSTDGDRPLLKSKGRFSSILVWV